MTTLAEWMCKADDGKPGESLGETSTEELKATLAKLEPTDPGAEGRISAIKAELKKRGGEGMDKATVEIEVNSENEDEDKKEMEKGELSPEKARQMLHERSGGHGRPITEQQRKFFGAVGGHLPAPGGKAKKSMATSLDDWMAKAGPFIGPRGGKYADPEHKTPWKEGGGEGGEGGHPTHEVEFSQKVVDHAKMKGGFGMSGKVPTKTVKGRKKVSLGDEHYSHGEKFHEATSGWGPEAHNAVAKHYREKAKEHGEGSKGTAYRHAANAHAAVAKKVKGGDRTPVKEGADVYGIVDHIAKMNQHLKKSLEGAEDMTDELQKAKYKSKKRVGNRWVYDYGEKKGTGGGGGAKQEPWANFTQDQMGDLQEAVMGGDKKKYESMTGQKWEDRPKEWGGGKGAGAKPAGGKNTQGGKLPEPKVSTIGNATMRDYGSLGLTRTQGGYHAALDAEGTELGEYGSLAEAQNKLLSMKKSLDGQTGLEDWLQKSGGLPTHEPKLGAGKSAAVEGGSADGGEVAGVGMTSGSSDSSPGPGQDGSGQLKGVGTGSKQKLSEDDADEEKQMTSHKKPIETARKSRFPADQRSSVAHETAQRVSQLQKSADVYVGPDAHPLSHVRQHGGADNAASELVKSEGFYHGMSPQTARPSVPLGQGVLCKSIHAAGCDTVYTAALTACPDCGAGTVGHRALPGGVVMGAETAILEKSEGHGNLLRPRPQEPDVKIGE